MVNMPGKGFTSIGIRDNQYKRLKEIKKEGESIPSVIDRIFDMFEEAEANEKDKGDGKELPIRWLRNMATKEDLKKAIKGLENDISVLVWDAVKDAFAEMKGY